MQAMKRIHMDQSLHVFLILLYMFLQNTALYSLAIYTFYSKECWK
jgi:hypothetical protein